MDVYSQIAESIIKQQETIIGPVAIEQAQQVADLQLNWEKHEVSVLGKGANVIDDLIERYKTLFGPLSVEVCKDAARPFLAQLQTAQVPNLLK
jgi:hypothetical protein